MPETKSLSVDLIDPATKASRDNLPEEDRLRAVLYAAYKESEAAYGACARGNALWADLRGTAFNCQTAFISVDAVLLPVDPPRWRALNVEIGRRIQPDPDAKEPALQRLLLVLHRVQAACDVVEKLHDEADPEGFCNCSLCHSLFAARYNADIAFDLILNELKPDAWPKGMRDEIEGGCLVHMTDHAADMPAQMLASADLTASRRAPLPSPAGPKRPRHYWEPSND